MSLDTEPVIGASQAVTPNTSDDVFVYRPEHDDILFSAARQATTSANWDLLRNIIKYKLERIIRDFSSNPDALFNTASNPPFAMDASEIDEHKQRIFALLDASQGPPFTLQRLCELVLEPRKGYTKLPKYLRSITKTVLVSLPASDFPPDTYTYDVTSLSGGISNDPTEPASVGSLAAIMPRSTHPSPASAPLLSPIPFLQNRTNGHVATDDDDLASDFRLDDSRSSPERERVRATPAPTDMSSLEEAPPTAALADVSLPRGGRPAPLMSSIPASANEAMQTVNTHNQSVSSALPVDIIPSKPAEAARSPALSTVALPPDDPEPRDIAQATAGKVDEMDSLMTDAASTSTLPTASSPEKTTAESLEPGLKRLDQDFDADKAAADRLALITDTNSATNAKHSSP